MRIRLRQPCCTGGFRAPSAPPQTCQTTTMLPKHNARPKPVSTGRGPWVALLVWLGRFLRVVHCSINGRQVEDQRSLPPQFRFCAGISYTFVPGRPSAGGLVIVFQVLLFSDFGSEHGEIETVQQCRSIRIIGNVSGAGPLAQEDPAKE